MSYKKHFTDVNEDEMHDAEKLIIYYSLNLVLFNELDNALQLIERYAVKVEGSYLYKANVHKIMGLIYLQKGEL